MFRHPIGEMNVSFPENKTENTCSPKNIDMIDILKQRTLVVH